jgi:hypothetical protein
MIKEEERIKGAKRKDIPLKINKSKVSILLTLPYLKP